MNNLIGLENELNQTYELYSFVSNVNLDIKHKIKIRFNLYLEEIIKKYLNL